MPISSSCSAAPPADLGFSASTAFTARARLVIARTCRSAATASSVAIVSAISRASAASIRPLNTIIRRWAQSSAPDRVSPGLS